MFGVSILNDKDRVDFFLTRLSIVEVSALLLFNLNLYILTHTLRVKLWVLTLSFKLHIENKEDKG